MSPVEIHRGSSPVILGLPHTGTEVPAAIRSRLNDNGLLLADTDWHIDRLYDGLLADATTVRATFHRYVIDANRDPSGKSLYPGQNTTGLVPLTDFDDKPIWKDGEEPTEGDIASRLAAYHRPYRIVLAAEVSRVKAKHGVAILYDCHSIRSRCPFLFEGTLPDFNIGTFEGRSCAPEVEEAVRRICAAAPGYTHVVNGRFKGGWTTRHFGKPRGRVHAIQMELTQSTHLDTEALPFAYSPEKAGRLRKHLGEILTALERLAGELAKPSRKKP